MDYLHRLLGYKGEEETIMTCPYCMRGMYQQGLSGYQPDRLQQWGLSSFHQAQHLAMAQDTERLRSMLGMEAAPPLKSKLNLAKEYAADAMIAEGEK